MQDVYQIITDRLLVILEAGTVPWRKPWNYGREKGPLNLVSRKHYQGINCFLLACTSYDSPYWLTFRQAQGLGGKVRRGEKGSPVIFWKIYEKVDPKAEDGKKRLPILRYYTVFNVGQCEGITVPPLEDSTWNEHDPIKEAEAVISAMPNRPTVEIGGTRACYSPSRDRVRVPDLFRYERAEEYYSTFFHELAHSTGHKSRLNREGIVDQHFFGDSIYSREELVAEMAAAFLCGHTGIVNATIENSAAYGPITGFCQLHRWVGSQADHLGLAIDTIPKTPVLPTIRQNFKAQVVAGLVCQPVAFGFRLGLDNCLISEHMSNSYNGHQSYSQNGLESSRFYWNEME